MATYSRVLAWRFPMDRGAWQDTVYGVAKSPTWLSNWHTHNVFSGEIILYQTTERSQKVFNSESSPLFFFFIFDICSFDGQWCLRMKFLAIYTTHFRMILINWYLLNYSLDNLWKYVFSYLTYSSASSDTVSVCKFISQMLCFLRIKIPIHGRTVL